MEFFLENELIFQGKTWREGQNSFSCRMRKFEAINAWVTRELLTTENVLYWAIEYLESRIEFWGGPVGLPFMFHVEEKSNSGSRNANFIRLGGLRRLKFQRY